MFTPTVSGAMTGLGIDVGADVCSSPATKPSRDKPWEPKTKSVPASSRLSNQTSASVVRVRTTTKTETVPVTLKTRVEKSDAVLQGEHSATAEAAYRPGRMPCRSLRRGVSGVLHLGVVDLAHHQ